MPTPLTEADVNQALGMNSATRYDSTPPSLSDDTRHLSTVAHSKTSDAASTSSVLDSLNKHSAARTHHEVALKAILKDIKSTHGKDIHDLVTHAISHAVHAARHGSRVDEINKYHSDKLKDKK